ncbi:MULTISPECIES: hypothetical protein [Streptomyces]|uniref:hypothetical protein n=1 Tax=Streptomyces TaxID=1883 RepID=UPI001587C01B|nr:hypothetical protein [Streptomyces sp. CAI-85]NUV59537.1 hypothetical protein [Streptomyces sp. CAI-85]
MTVDQLPGRVREFASYLNGLLVRLDQGSGWCAVFWRRDPDGMRACAEGREVPPWDVVEALLQDLATDYGAPAAAQEAYRVRPLHIAALAAHDARPGGRDALADRLDVMLREQRYAAERQAELGRRLAAAATREEADALRVDLAWAQDDHARATARCAELRHRIAEFDRRTANALRTGGGQARGSAGRYAAPAPYGPYNTYGTPGPHETEAPRAQAEAGSVAGSEPHRPAPAETAPEPEPAASTAPTTPAAPASPPAPPTPTPTPTVPKQRKRRRGSARFAGMDFAEADAEEAAPVVVPPSAAPPAADPAAVPPEAVSADAAPTAAPAARRSPRGARFAGADAEADASRDEPRREPLDAAARQETVAAVERLVALRAQGLSGEAHALLAECAHWPAARMPLLAAELRRAGLSADWTTLLWEAASLPADRLVAAADALVAVGRTADGEQILRQGVARPAAEIGHAVLVLAAEGRHREMSALLDAYVRVRAPEEAVRSVVPDPHTLVPLLLEAARGVSDECHWDLVHALRVAGLTA